MTAMCPLCGTEIQRTIYGTLADGMRAHYETVHPNDGEGNYDYDDEL